MKCTVKRIAALGGLIGALALASATAGATPIVRGDGDITYSLSAWDGFSFVHVAPTTTPESRVAADGTAALIIADPSIFINHATDSLFIPPAGPLLTGTTGVKAQIGFDDKATLDPLGRSPLDVEFVGTFGGLAPPKVQLSVSGIDWFEGGVGPALTNVKIGGINRPDGTPFVVGDTLSGVTLISLGLDSLVLEWPGGAASFSTFGGDASNHFTLLSQVVPEPATLLLLGLGLTGLGLRRRKI